MSREIATTEADVLIIGGGISGCFAAIKAKEAGIGRVVQVDKGRVAKTGCSVFAAGVFPLPGDDVDDWIRRDTRYRGYLLQQDRMSRHAEQVHGIVEDIESFGLEFLRTAEGQRERVTEARGKVPYLTYPGGFRLMDAIGKAARKKGVEQINRTMITDLLTSEGRVVGAVGFDTQTGEFRVFKSRATVLATGLTLYKGLLPGHRNCTGDGYVAAYRAGAALSGAESCYETNHLFPARYDIGPGMNAFIALGGKFLNVKGERFMAKYDPSLQDRAPLTRLAQAFAMEVTQGNGPLYMDMTGLTTEQVRKMRQILPLPVRAFERAGIIVGDKVVSTVEWTVTAPYCQGGLKVNDRFEASLPGLYACGEAAAPQALTSSMPYAATSGAATGRSAADYAREATSPKVEWDQVEQLREYALQPLELRGGIEPDQVLLSLQETIVPYDVLLIRDDKRMKQALQQVLDIQANQVLLLHAYDPHYLRMAIEARNMVFMAELQLRSAIFRTESRIGLREDYPYEDNMNWLKWVVVKQDNGQMKLETEDVPIDKYPHKPEREKSLHRMWQRAQINGIIRIEEERVVWA